MKFLGGVAIHFLVGFLITIWVQYYLFPEVFLAPSPALRDPEQLQETWYWYYIGKLMISLASVFLFIRAMHNPTLGDACQFGLVLAVIFIGVDLMLFSSLNLSAVTIGASIPTELFISCTSFAALKYYFWGK